MTHRKLCPDWARSVRVARDRGTSFICKQREWIVESQLPQVFFERLRWLISRKLKRQPL